MLRASKLEWNSSKYSQRNLKISFQFIDEKNDFIEEKFLEIPVVEQNLILSFPSVKFMKQYFKPGLPYFGHVMAVHPDYSPVSGQSLEICYENRENPWVSKNEYQCRGMVSNSEGLAEFTIPPMKKDIKQIEVRVKSTVYPSIERTIYLEPTYSPSDEFMTIKPIINKNHCNEPMVDFEVFFNKEVDNKNVYYQVEKGIKLDN